MILLVLIFLLIVAIAYIINLKMGNNRLHEKNNYLYDKVKKYKVENEIFVKEIGNQNQIIIKLQNDLKEEQDKHKIEMTVRVKPSQVFEVKEFIENLK